MVSWNLVITHSVNESLQWSPNGRDGVSNHQPHWCLLSRLITHRSKKTPKLHVTGLCAGNSPDTGEFPAHMASNAGNVSINFDDVIVISAYHTRIVTFTNVDNAINWVLWYFSSGNYTWNAEARTIEKYVKKYTLRVSKIWILMAKTSAAMVLK